MRTTCIKQKKLSLNVVAVLATIKSLPGKEGKQMAQKSCANILVNWHIWKPEQCGKDWKTGRFCNRRTETPNLYKKCKGQEVWKQMWLRMFKIRRIDISFLHCVTCSQLLLLCYPEVVSMNAFFNDQINIFCCKRLKFYFFA